MNGLTIRELIEELKKFPESMQDAEVKIQDPYVYGEEFWEKVRGVEFLSASEVKITSW